MRPTENACTPIHTRSSLFLPLPFGQVEHGDFTTSFLTLPPPSLLDRRGDWNGVLVYTLKIFKEIPERADIARTTLIKRVTPDRILVCTRFLLPFISTYVPSFPSASSLLSILYLLRRFTVRTVYRSIIFTAIYPRRYRACGFIPFARVRQPVPLAPDRDAL